MTNFIIYDDAGNILRTGCCIAEFLSMQAQDGEHVMEGQADMLTQMIDTITKEIVSKT